MHALCTHHARTLQAISDPSLSIYTHQAISDLSVFVVLLLVILLGFVMMASNIFGSQVMSYRDIFSSFGTLLLIPTLAPTLNLTLTPDPEPNP